MELKMGPKIDKKSYQNSRSDGSDLGINAGRVGGRGVDHQTQFREVPVKMRFSTPCTLLRSGAADLQGSAHAADLKKRIAGYTFLGT